EITLRANPRARRYIVNVNPTTGEVSVVAPSQRSLKEALAFARKEREWIAGRLAELLPPVPLEVGQGLLLGGIEYRIQAAPDDIGPGRYGPVWADYLTQTIYVSGRPEHHERRLRDWLKREARKRID